MTNNTITRRRFRRWAKDAGERAVRTFAQAFVVALPIASDSGLSIEAFLEWEPYSLGFGAAALSVLMSLGAKRSGSPATARIRG